MKFSIPANELHAALARAEMGACRITGRIPILKDLHVTVDDGALSAIGTDLEIAVTAVASCEVLESGSAILPRALVKASKAWGADIVTLETVDDIRKDAKGVEHYQGILTVTHKLGQWKAPLLFLVSDCPLVNPGELQHVARFPGAKLRRMIEQVSFAMSDESTRYYLNGIFLHTSTECGEISGLLAVTTDGHRLALHDTGIECPQFGPDSECRRGVIMPRLGVNVLAKLAAKSDSVEFSIGNCGDWSKARLRFSAPGWTLVANVVDGDYPDYSRVIPSFDDATLIKVQAPDFSAAIKTLTAGIKDKTRGVKIETGADCLHLSTQDPETGASTLTVPAETTKAGYVTRFQARYLLDAAARGDGAMIFAGQDPGAPHNVEHQAADTRLVLMPMRT